MEERMFYSHEVAGSNPAALPNCFEMDKQEPYTAEELETCLSVLRRVAKQPALAQEEKELKSLIAKIYKQARKENRQIAKAQHKERDSEKKRRTFIFQTNDEHHKVRLAEQNFEPKDIGRLNKPNTCYICKTLYREIHPFYHLLCNECATFNFLKRHQTADLKGRLALLTGGRKKIGFEIGLKLLRAGAELVVTTRFPNNAWQVYQKQKDARDWQDRLHIFGLDLRNIRAIEHFTERLYEQFDALDFIINNAAQTIRRPLAFYQHLLEREEHNFLLESREQIQGWLVGSEHFPMGQFDKDFQQLDLRPNNSWVRKLEKVSTLEWLEVQLVNSMAPFLLNSRLKKLLAQSAFERKFIVNVSAVEGQFNRYYKSPNHPHTNMAKAALNMMTRTSASDYAKSGIYMTSVDTGWITDENPHPTKVLVRESGFVPPLDLIDGAARVLAPIFDGLSQPETPVSGVFLKDYKPTVW